MAGIVRPSGSRAYRVEPGYLPGFNGWDKVWIHHDDGSNVPLVTDGARFVYLNRSRLLSGPRLLYRLVAHGACALVGALHG